MTYRSHLQKSPEECEFSRVVFGVNSSPFLAQFVTQHHAKTHESEYPLTAETILKSTYMDDSMDSVSDDQQGIELYRQLSQLWKGAGMHARKWLSNSPTVLNEIPSDDRASEIDLKEGHLPCTKTLGGRRKMRSSSRFDHLVTISPSPSVTSCPR